MTFLAYNEGQTPREEMGGPSVRGQPHSYLYSSYALTSRVNPMRVVPKKVTFLSQKTSQIFPK